MKIFGVIGSPRPGKNTASLVKAALAGAASLRVETSDYVINDYHIQPCNACDECKQTGVCVVGDDMNVFYRAINTSQGIVIGTPIYFDHVSAQTKIFLDRLYAYLGNGLENSFPSNYKAVLVTTWGDGNPDLYDNVIEWTRERLRYYYDIQTVASIKASAFEEFSPEDRQTLLDQAYQAGIKLVESLRA